MYVCMYIYIYIYIYTHTGVYIYTLSAAGRGAGFRHFRDTRTATRCVSQRCITLFLCFIAVYFFWKLYCIIFLTIVLFVLYFLMSFFCKQQVCTYVVSSRCNTYHYW